jgi:predicted small metal-binding protein
VKPTVLPERMPLAVRDMHRPAETAGGAMGKVLKCHDVLGCDEILYGNDENEVIGKAEDHARSSHNMTIIPPDVVRDIVDHILDGEAPPKRYWWQRAG